MNRNHSDINLIKTNDEIQPDLVEGSIAFWEKRFGRSVSSEEAREMIDNIVGFFTLLNEWDSLERPGSN